jgi:hypothetical protein
MMAVVWSAAAAGIAVKLFLPGRFDRLAVVFYLAIGWSGTAITRVLLETLPSSTLWLLVTGGIVYSCGVVFSPGGTFSVSVRRLARFLSRCAGAVCFIWPPSTPPLSHRTSP